MTTFDLGGVRVTHLVDHDADLVLPFEDAVPIIEANRDALVPAFATEDHSIRITTAAVCVETDTTRFVIDPFSAFAVDDRTTPEARTQAERRVALMADAGFGPDDVDAVVLTHFDGSGALTTPGPDGEAVNFEVPHLMTAPALDMLRTTEPAGASGGHAIDAAGLFEVVEPGPILGGAATLVPLEAHGAGHVGVLVEGTADTALCVGHLFVHPVQVYDLAASVGDQFPERLTEDRTTALQTAGAGLLVGPLFCEPGAIRVAEAAQGWTVTRA